MKMKKDLSDSKYYIAPEIKSMLDRGKTQVLTKDWDRVYVIDGEEGSGKSLLGLQLGYYLDPTLNLSKITFSGKEFTDAIKKAKKGECIIFDEAFNGLASTGAMSQLNRLIIRNLQECRQKNLFIIIILPTIFMLQKYVGIFRSKVLFHVYATSKGDRGYYRVYNKINKKYLYLIGKTLYSYAKPYVRNSYRFYGIYPIDESSYREKKLEAIKLEQPNVYVSGKKWELQRNVLIIYLSEKLKMSYIDIEKLFKDIEYPMKDSQIGNIVRENAQKIANMP